jgi:hypothetical protein
MAFTCCFPKGRVPSFLLETKRAMTAIIARLFEAKRRTGGEIPQAVVDANRELCDLPEQ